MVSVEWRLLGNHGEFKRLEGLPDLHGFIHGFSTRLGGCSRPPFAGLNLGTSTGDEPERVQQNRYAFLGAMNCPNVLLQTLKQGHSNNVILLCKDRPLPHVPPAGDAIVTDWPDVLLGVQTADCYSILLADPEKQVVAAVHTGWRGTASSVALHTLRRMKEKWKCSGESLVALIGPGIGPCCCQVGTDVYDAFSNSLLGRGSWFIPDFHSESLPGPRWRLDLRSANRAQLEAGGLSPSRIFALDDCSVCRSELYYSYRRDGATTGRMLSVIGIAGSRDQI